MAYNIERLQHTIANAPLPQSEDNILNKRPEDGEGMIVDVWAKNLHEEMQKIMEIIDDYPYVAMVITLLRTHS
jgi:hypothetical protein